MATAKVYDQQRNEVGEMELLDDIFGVEVKSEILHQAVRLHLAKNRAGTVGVKTRSQVRGGGKKPWRQKGTGRARAGSIRSPLWTGGAVVHGPQARSYGFKINKKVRKLALKMALTSRFVEDNLMIVDSLKVENHKTKEFVGIKSALGLKKALIVIPETYSDLELSARNLPGVSMVTQDSLNIYEILRHPQLVILKGAIEGIQERVK